MELSLQPTTPVPAEQRVSSSQNPRIIVQVDKPFYLPGQRIQGQVQLNFKDPTKIRSLEISFQGTEDVHFTTGAGKSSRTYKATNPMVSTGLKLSGEATVPAGSTNFPFTFDIPPDALPSYVGKCANVTWMLSARGDVPWGGDLKQDVSPIVVNNFYRPAVPVAFENTEVSPRIRLELTSNVYQPEETIEGKLVLLDAGNIRAVRLQLFQTEHVTGKGTMMGISNGNKAESMKIGEVLEWPRDNLLAAREVPFRIPLSPMGSCSYSGKYSSIVWSLDATLDIPHHGDIHLSAPFTVAMRTIPVAVIQPQGPVSPRVETPLSMPAQLVVPQEIEPQESQLSVIVEILADGSAKDVVSVSNELEKKDSFVDINQVKGLCEKLVQQGRIERVGEGEFFAQYRLRTVAPSQSTSP
jgi:hypothetical protein